VPPEDGRLTPETCRGLRHNKVFVKVYSVGYSIVISCYVSVMWSPGVHRPVWLPFQVQTRTWQGNVDMYIMYKNMVQ
jgi:hypothetical protein